MCRKSKKSCSGDNPCSRCVRMRKDCTYSKKPRASKKIIPRKRMDTNWVVVDPISDTEAKLTSDYAAQHLIQVYCSHINPPGFLMNVSVSPTMEVDTKAKQLQYVTALATAARVLKQPYISFQMNAQALARDLMDNISLETAQAFSLLSFHFWPEAQTYAEHYRATSLSLIQQINRKITRGQINPEQQEILMRTELGAVICTTLTRENYELKSLKRRLQTFLESFQWAESKPSGMIASLGELYQIVSFNYEFHSLMLVDHQDPEGILRVPTFLKSPEERDRMCLILEKVKRLFIDWFSDSPIYPLYYGFMQVDTALIHYYAGMTELAIAELEEVALHWDSNAQLISCGGPVLVTLLCYLESISVREQRHDLALVFGRVIEQMGETCPDAKSLRERLLRTCVFQQQQQEEEEFPTTNSLDVVLSSSWDLEEIFASSELSCCSPGDSAFDPESPSTKSPSSNTCDPFFNLDLSLPTFPQGPFTT